MYLTAAILFGGAAVFARPAPLGGGGNPVTFFTASLSFASAAVFKYVLKCCVCVAGMAGRTPFLTGMDDGSRGAESGIVQHSDEIHV